MGYYKKVGKGVTAYLLAFVMLVTSVAWGMPTTSSAAKKKVKSITLTKPVIQTLTLKKGSSYSLKVSVLPKNAANKKVTYKSTKKSVVSVTSKGKLKAKKVGNAKITITAKDGSKKKTSLKVSVVKSFTKTKKVSLTPSKKTLYVGESITLKTGFQPKKATVKKVTFVSSKTSIATVTAKGLVKAKKAGKTVITAYASDGGGAKATCQLEVKNKPIATTPAPNKATPKPTAKVTAVVPTTTPISSRSPRPTQKPLPTSEPKSGNELDTVGFDLVKADKAPNIYLDSDAEDYEGLKLIANSFVKDINNVTEVEADLKDLPENSAQLSGEIIIVGSLGNNSLIDKWVEEGKIYIGDVRPYWETYSIIAVENPEENIDKALVIVGSDKRGTIYGMYHISEMMGVSPWYYWGDVEIKKQDELKFTKEKINYTSKQPSVKYRGIFLNDEAPSLSSWVSKYFAEPGKAYNEKFYDHVFELILRLKGNYLWPAMWNSKFNADGVKTPDANSKLADTYGIVMGTSHHEPMMRADKEWIGEKKDWNYATNKTVLDKFWDDSAKERGKYENLITLGMRGMEDTTLLPSTATVQENVEHLKDIISNQKKILKNNNLENAPKVLTLYKEVEEYWYGGEGVKGLNEWDELNDVTIMLAEDNFGNLRTLPNESNCNRDAGWGMYYHFDYHGAPRSYEWVHTLQMQKTWEQMTMAYDYGVQDVWIVNVGDLKPMEMPISYFLDMAYDFDTWGTSDTESAGKYTEKWVEQQFGNAFEENKKEQGIKDIVFMLDEYTKMNGSRKPEIVSSITYNATNYNEAMRMLDRTKALIGLADKYKKELPQEAQAAYYQLVYYPAVASANVHRMQIYAGLMELYAGQGRTIANLYADLVKETIAYDKELQETYNKNMPEVGNKWEGMMSSVHVGYAGWDDKGAAYPEYDYFEVPEEAAMIVAIQGEDKVYGAGTTSALKFTDINKEAYYVDIANGGGTAFTYTASADKDWIKLTKSSGKVLMQDTIGISVDFTKVSADATGTITIAGAEETVTIPISVKVESTSGLAEKTFVEAHDYISIEAAHYAESKAGANGEIWKEIKNYGKTLSSIKVWPTTSFFRDMTKAPYVEYKVRVNNAGNYVLQTYIAPSNNVDWEEVTMRYGVSIDGGTIIQKDTMDGAKITDLPRNDKGERQFGSKFIAGSGSSSPWSKNVMDNIRIQSTEHELSAGVHTIRIYAADPGLVLQKLVLCPKSKASAHSISRTYFGAEESYYVGKEVSQARLIADIQEEQVYTASCKMPANASNEYEVIVPKEGEYKIAVETEDANNAGIDVLWNDEKIGEISAAGSGIYSTPKLILKKDRGVLKLVVNSGSITIKNVQVSYKPKVIIGEPIYVRASSEDGASYATNAYDKNKRTLWKAAESDANPYLEFDFVEKVNIDRFAITEGAKSITGYEVKMYDGTSWETVYEGGEITNGEVVFIHGRKEINGQKLRIVFTEFESVPNIKEVDVIPYINWARADDKVALTGKDSKNNNMEIPAGVNDGDRITTALEAGIGTTSQDPGVNEVVITFGEDRMVDTVNMLLIQEEEKGYPTKGIEPNNGVAPTTSLKTEYAAQKYNVSYWDGNAWVPVKELVMSDQENRKVFNIVKFDEPVLTNKVKVEIWTSYWVRLVEFEALQTKYSTAVQDYAKSSLDSKTSNEIVLKKENMIDKIQIMTTNKDGSYTFEYASGTDVYTAISAGDIKSTVKTEDGLFIVLKNPIEAKKVRVTPPGGTTVSGIELWGLVPEPEED